MKKPTTNPGPILAAEVLDAPEGSWAERPWSQRRELGEDRTPFCDIAASHTLARLAHMGASQPRAQKFLSHGDLDAWMGDFAWGKAWCASRDGQFWAWAQGDGVNDSRAEVAGPCSLWDEDVADAFATCLRESSVD